MVQGKTQRRARDFRYGFSMLNPHEFSNEATLAKLGKKTSQLRLEYDDKNYQAKGGEI